MVVSVSALVALSAITASAAMATPAVFNTTGPLGFSDGLLHTTGLTIKVGTTPIPASTITCASPAVVFGESASNSGSPLQGHLSGLRIFGNCKSGTGANETVDLKSGGWEQATKSGAIFSLEGADANWTGTINGNISSVAGPASDGISNYTAAWTNGTSPASPSSVTFTEAKISKVTSGYAVGQPITLSGTLQVAVNKGALLTLK